MATIKFHGDNVNTSGNLPTVGSKAPDFSNLVKSDLSRTSLNDYKGQRILLNIFPSVDTGVCATAMRTFNKRASEAPNTKVLCVSEDLPFAQKRFCAAEGLENVETLSDFDGASFAKAYGVQMTDGPLKGLMARAVVALNENHEVVYTELVDEVASEPNYDAALANFK